MAKTVADALRKMGVEVRSFEEADDDLDGEVVISDKVHVQVGSDYLILCVERVVDGEEGAHFFPSRATVAAVYEDIKTWRRLQ